MTKKFNIVVVCRPEELRNLGDALQDGYVIERADSTANFISYVLSKEE